MAEHNREKAEELFGVLEKENNKRRKIGTEIFEDVCRRIEEEYDPETGKMIVLGDPSWHPGVLGIVASRIVEKYYRPVFLFAIKDGIARGSFIVTKAPAPVRALGRGQWYSTGHLP